MPQHECPTGKVRYDRPQDAHADAQRIKQRHGFDATGYQCAVCGGWHLTGHSQRHKLITAVRKRKRMAPYNRHDRTWLREVEL